MPKNEPKRTYYGCQDIYTVLHNDLDPSIVENHLDEQEQEKYNRAKNQSPIKRGDLGESGLSHAAQNRIKAALHNLTDYQKKDPGEKHQKKKSEEKRTGSLEEISQRKFGFSFSEKGEDAPS